MTLSFHVTTSPLFKKLGKIITAAKTLDTARTTTIPAEFEDVADEYATGSLDLQTIPDPLGDAIDALRSAGDATMATLREAFRQTIVTYIKEDTQQPTDTPEDAYAELIRQMKAFPAYVEYRDPSIAVVEVSAVGDEQILANDVDRFGRPAVCSFLETITIECVDDTTNGQEAFRFRGELAVDKLQYNWPGGSGCDVTITAATPNDTRNLIANGSFEDNDVDDAQTPDGWIRGGSSIARALTSVEVQTVVMTGTPTGGYWYLSFTANGITQRTDPLAYNASGADVQAALRSLVGLEQIEISTTGTTPDFSHTVTFYGVTNPATLVETDSALTGGTSPAITVTVGTAASATVFHEARAFYFTSTGAETGEVILIRLDNLTPATSYAIGFTAARTGSMSAGVFTVNLVDGVGGTVINDDAATANTKSVAYTDLGTSHAWFTAFFRTPTNLPDVVYLNVKIGTAFTNATAVYLDNFVMIPTTELYPGGIHVAIFAGQTHAVSGDRYTLDQTSSPSNEMQQYFNRFCDFADAELQLPSSGSVVAAVNEVQTFTSTHTSGSTATLTYDGQTTATFNFNVSAATLQGLLEALSNIAVGDVVCTGGPLNTTPIVITFGGELAGRNVSLITFNIGNFAGGAASIVQTTAGVTFLANSAFIT